MKEHRMKALRVTTTNNITRDGGDMFSSLQLLRLELELRPSSGRPMTPLRCLQQDSHQQRVVCCSRLPHHLHHHHHHHLHQDQKTSNSVLQECLSCENVPMIDDLLITSNPDITSIKSLQKCECDNASPLHMACGLPTSGPFLHKLCSSNGCDLSSRLFANSHASLHLLLTGDLQGNWSSVLEAAKLLAAVQQERRLGACREWHYLLSMTDSEGNTPLLIAGRRLLRDGAFEQAAELSRLLLEAGSDPNAANAEGRSLLTYSVHYMDDSIELTRVLLNSGASVWPQGAHNSSLETVENASTTEQCSAFTWFLRSIIRRRKLDEQCERTLALLSQVMGEHPGRMHGHVMRTMFRHAKCYKVLGPVFYQLKISMMRYWTQPQDLLFICRKAIRTAVGPERLMAGETGRLGLPHQMQGYLMLE
ncbi:uncharacterized protein [Periplaneta americana]|uniref:uncharacterized protein n=1 Tax=Periplaneta americana TaxID=6978 RepID=UPI0037E8CB77